MTIVDNYKNKINCINLLNNKYYNNISKIKTI